MKDNILRLQVIEARNLMAKDRGGTSDPFAVVTLGSQTQKTAVVSKTLKPKWNMEMDFNVTSVHIDASLHISVWDKDLVGRDFLGQLQIPIHDLLKSTSSMFMDASNQATWYPLNPRSLKEPVHGEILLRLGFVGKVDDEMTRLMKAFESNLSINAQLVSSDDPIDELYFNHASGLTHPLAPGGKAEPENDESSESSDTTAVLDQTDLVGLLAIEIQRTSKLPGKQGKGLMDCDPFVIISYGKKTFRTRVQRHTTEPVWNERVFLHIKKNELENDWIVAFSVYDHDTLSNNDFICTSNTKLKELIATAKVEIETIPNIHKEFKPTTMPIPMTMKKEGADPATLFLSVAFVPYKDLRRNFWLSLAKTYDTNGNGSINRVELSTMLDSIGSTFSEETINLMWERAGKNLKVDISYDEMANGLEEHLSGKTLTAAATGKEAKKFKGRDDEHVMQIRECPICRKTIKMKGDLDVVSHVALCAYTDISKVDNFVMGGFLTEAYASRKWYSKILSFVSYGGYNIGKNNANILVQDRSTGQLVEEKMPTYIRLGIRLLYQMSGTKTAVESKSIKNLLKNMSMKQGVKFGTPESVREIPHFIKFHNLSVDEILDPLDSFKNFNEFFYRKLKPSARPLASADPKNALSPADARLNVFPTISDAIRLWIKGHNFSLAHLLNDAEMAKKFDGGGLVIARLAPQDYHRFHIPVDGQIVRIDPVIEGAYFTVNPMAVRTTVDVYTENVRRVTYIQSEQFGLVAYVNIGAMMVGSIVLTNSVGAQVKRMDELGYFAFGGSTVLVIFQANKIVFDKDIVDNSEQSLETLVKVGNSIGYAV